MRCWLAIVVLLLGSAAHAADPARPSFVVLITDDQRADSLSCAGHPLLKTPNIDRLAAGGVMFTNAFVTTAICCTSRANYLTGRYARNHGVHDFRTPLSPEVLGQSLPALLKKAGYRMGCLGKYGIGGKPPDQLFDVWNAWGGQGSFFHTIDGEKIHNSEYLARQADAFLKGCKPDQPFCLLVYYKAPHDPFLPDEADADLFKNDTIKVPATYNDESWKKLPPFLQTSEGRRRLMKRHPTPARYQEFVKQYLRCVASVDRSVGKITASLARHKRADNTLIVYGSDHGFFLGEHGLSGKWFMHEESIRIPLIVNYAKLPEKMRGRKLPQMVLSIDVAPTLLDFAGVEVPKEMDGRSLRPLLEDREVAWRSDFFYEHLFQHKFIPRSEGVRTDQWKYVVYPDARPVVEELFDLKNDPQEQTNLVRDPAHQGRLRQLRKRHQEYLKELPKRPALR